MHATVLDTGPIVAALSQPDDRHAECAKLFQNLRGRWLLPAPVMVEVCWLLERRPTSEAAFLREIACGTFELVSLTSVDLGRMAELVTAYRDLPLGAVDASVIAVAERLDVAEVATLDHRHFTVVRPRHVTEFRLLP